MKKYMIKNINTYKQTESDFVIEESYITHLSLKLIL